jgi:hypothetical protein
MMDTFSSIPDSMNRGIHAFNYFWASVFATIAATLILQFVGIIIASLSLAVIGGILAGAGAMALQAEFVRRTFVEATRKEFAKYLPQIAEEQWQPIFEAVQKSFDGYAQQVGERINNDISSRRAELDSLLQQKQSHEIDIKAEVKRLQDLEIEMRSQIQQIDFARSTPCH